jgi:nicotinamidase-related amidase
VARSKHIPVIFVNYQSRPGGPDAKSRFWMSGGVQGLYPNVAHQQEGSRWAEIIPELEPCQTDFYVNTKRRYSAFYGTDLDLLLRNLRVETVILTGVMTEICVLCSAFEAFNRDYRVVVVKDCTAGRDPETEVCVLERIIGLEVGWALTEEELVARLQNLT